ncbi:condensation domain protein [Collimonas fungivorans]|uniref:Condensation domain protein n=1 Tax=Collimonas fungivorans TaxID=158899 RepID=A0A127P6E4_9BURK|nr:phosphopantetheine-binding protein [Collimonas fungivorans]AMO93244.1 condensation domain protein [Collimonas fungivorans]
MLDVAALRDALALELPHYMVPTAFVQLKALPLTPNGKLDRKALPAPEGEAFVRRMYEAPVGEIEQMLASIWSELLKIEKVGRHDNFFELGGHSLLATQVISKLRKALELELPLRAMFESPTVEALAAHAAGEQAQPLELLPIVAVSRQEALALSFAQERLWFLDQFEGQSAIYNIPVSLRLQGTLDTQALQRTLNELVRRHESLRTTFDSLDGFRGN